ncbi:MAG TPA: SDR family NAD(P)-dependent oxidoreductase, partial [Acidimicrobiales bacterium]
MRVVVVGASSGLGRCLAFGLGKTGARVALMARRRDRIEAAAAEIGSDAVAIVCDVHDETSIAAALDEAAELMGGI